MSTFFIAGIDTDTGKSIATGLLARYLMSKDIKVITQKLAQTGCENISEDIITHRRLMSLELLEEDKLGITCPYIFKTPASPHLAASIENSSINVNKITDATKKLELKYDIVLLEGVGGLHVPLNDKISTLDYLEDMKYPVILVSSPKLGSINHTLLTLEVLHNRNIPLLGIVYNLFIDSNKKIINDSKKVFKKYLKKYNFPDTIVDMPVCNNPKIIEGFSKFF